MKRRCNTKCNAIPFFANRYLTPWFVDQAVDRPPRPRRGGRCRRAVTVQPGRALRDRRRPAGRRRLHGALRTQEGRRLSAVRLDRHEHAQQKKHLSEGSRRDAVGQANDETFRPCPDQPCCYGGGAPVFIAMKAYNAARAAESATAIAATLTTSDQLIPGAPSRTITVGHQSQS